MRRRSGMRHLGRRLDDGARHEHFVSDLTLDERRPRRDRHRRQSICRRQRQSLRRHRLRGRQGSSALFIGSSSSRLSQLRLLPRARTGGTRLAPLAVRLLNFRARNDGSGSRRWLWQDGRRNPVVDALDEGGALGRRGEGKLEATEEVGLGSGSLGVRSDGRAWADDKLRRTEVLTAQRTCSWQPERGRLIVSARTTTSPSIMPLLTDLGRGRPGQHGRRLA